jgi:hypothetical protein
MPETFGRRWDAECRTAITAEQIARQRRGAALLVKMLDRAAAEGLPPVAWTIASGGAGLAGRCEACQMAQRRVEFSAWRLAVDTWAGKRADARRKHADSSGSTRLIDQWDRFEGVTVTLVADIWATG